MTGRRRIYLDNAATSWPKPEGVYAAVDRYQRQVGAPGGRGVYRQALEVDDAIQATRAAVAKLLGASSPDQVVFTSNGTDALNLAIHGALQPGDHVVTSVVEHNSVLRPLRWLEDRGQIQVTRVGCDASGLVDPEDIRKAIRPETRLIALIHASNVTGTLQPAAEVGRIAREHDKLFLLDAAQTLGHMPLSVDALGVDFLAAPGHKGLLGPAGTGVLYIRNGREKQLESRKQGGTGTSSSEDIQPLVLPHKFESGSLNLPGLVGLQAGVDYLSQRGLENIQAHAHGLTQRLRSGLSSIPGVTVFGPADASQQVGVTSAAVEGRDAVQVASALDADYGIQTRAGLQCAGLLHRTLGTIDRGGTIRFSMGPFNTVDDMESALGALEATARRKVFPVGIRLDSCAAQRGPSPQVVAAEASPPIGLGQLAGAFDIAGIPGLKELWEETTGDPGIRVAVLDGPVDRFHDCFDGADLTIRPTLVNESAGTGRMSAHGTHVASMIFGQPGGPVRGIAPGCQGLIIPIFSDQKQGPASQAELARAINEAVAAGAQVINISGGELSDAGQADASLIEAVRHAADQGALLVAAAGNDSCRCLHVPAGLPSVLAVGATDARGAPLDTSNWGEAYASQGILAPGQNMLGAAPGGGVAVRSGTSFATPVVSGIATLLLSLQRQRGETPDPQAVRAALLDAAIPCDTRSVSDCRRFLAGQMDVSGTYSLLSQSRRSAMSDLTTAGGAIPVHAPAQFSSAAGTVSLSGAEAEHGALAPSESTAASGLAVETSSEGAAVQPASTSAATVADRPPVGHRNVRTGSGQPSGRASGVAASCGCQASDGAKGGKVYVLGTLGYDFGTEARRDGFTALMPSLYAPQTGTPTPETFTDLIPYIHEDGVDDGISPYPPNPYDPRQMVNYLAGYPRPTDGFPTEGGFPTSTLPSPPWPFPPPFPQADPDVAAQGGYAVYPPPMPKEYKKYPAHIADAAQLIWTLNIDLTPVYAIRPAGSFSTVVYQRLVEFLDGQVRDARDPEYISRVAIPAVLTGETVRLYSGQVIPVIEPQVRGMTSWNETAVIKEVIKNLPAAENTVASLDAALKGVRDLTRVQVEQVEQSTTASPEEKQKLADAIRAAGAQLETTTQANWIQTKYGEQQAHEELVQQTTDGLQEFIARVYYDLRNPGQSSSDRALNFAATNIFSAATVLLEGVADGQQLESFTTEKSAYCRKDSDCWDVKMRLFDPDDVLRARSVARFTVDVSDTYPVLIGPVRRWAEAP